MDKIDKEKIIRELKEEHGFLGEAAPPVFMGEEKREISYTDDYGEEVVEYVKKPVWKCQCNICGKFFESSSPDRICEVCNAEIWSRVEEELEPEPEIVVVESKCKKCGKEMDALEIMLLGNIGLCRKCFNAEKSKESKKEEKPIKCKRCGEEFVPFDPRHRYCSDCWRKIRRR